MAQKSTTTWEIHPSHFYDDFESRSPEEQEVLRERLRRQSRVDKIRWSRPFNHWLRSAGGSLVAGGGAVALAYLVGSLPLNYQAASFFYIAYAVVLGTASALYLYVKRQMGEKPLLSGVVLFLMAASLLYYMIVGIGTFASHHGSFAPWPGGWPLPAFTNGWWQFVAGCLTAAIFGLCFRFSADSTDRSIELQIGVLQAQGIAEQDVRK
jgi:hypothetical protein